MRDDATFLSAKIAAIFLPAFERNALAQQVQKQSPIDSGHPITAQNVTIMALEYLQQQQARPVGPDPGHRARGAADASIVSVREAVARLESYEPICALTRRTLRAHRQTRQLSTAVLRLEVQRLQRSPIVLNRGLREAVIAATERHGLSMSEIAMRCGRIKYDRAGNASGETSWLARRLGILPEGGQQAPTPWIHSDVLALIARRGLGVSPREVELD